MTETEKNIKQQNILCITLCALISYLPLTNFVNDVCNKFVGEGFIYDSLACYTVLLVLIIKSLAIVMKNIKKDVLLITFLFLMAWVITYAFFPDNRKYMVTSVSDVMGNPFYVLFVFSFSGYIFSRYITDFERLERIFVWFAVATVIGSIISFFLTLGKNFQKQYMVFAYNILIHITYLTIYYFEKKNPLYIIVAVIGFVTMSVAGCRGAVVSLFACIAVYGLFRKTELWKKAVLVLVLSVLAYMVYVNFKQIISWLVDIADKYKIDSYTLKRIEAGEFLNDSGRSVIQDKVIARYNLFGHGLYGDRVLSGGSYAHQFIIEIISQFGYVFGFPILAVVFVIIARGLLANDKHLRNLVIVFLSTGLFKLFFSSSYLNQEPAFYILLGLCINCFDYKRQLIMGEKQNVHTSENV